MIDFIRQPAGPLPRVQPVSGEDRGRLHLRVHDEIHHEQVRQHRRRLAHVLVQGISLQHAVSDLRI